MRHKKLLTALSVVCLMVSLGLVGSVFAQQDEEHTGFVSDAEPEARYTIQLAASQTVTITAEAISGGLDTVLGLFNAAGEEVAFNDDFGGTLNSQIGYTAREAGTYTIVISNYPGSSGEYLLTISYGTAAGGTSTTGGVSSGTSEGPIPDRAPDQTHTGPMSDSTPDARYNVSLQAGQGIVASARAEGSGLDTFLLLMGPDGEEVSRNDDAEPGVTTDSLIVYQAAAAGQYTVVVTNFPGTSGNYVLDIWILSAAEILSSLESTRVQFSGPRQVYDTENFRIHYTLEGKDATTLEFVELVAQTMEEVYDIQINQLGWAAPPPDGQLGGDSRYDVYLLELLGEEVESRLLGYNSPEGPEGDNPNTAEVEPSAVPSYLVIDNDYAQDQLEDGTSIQVMRATAAHEFHHGIQFGYDAGRNEFRMFYEATASWMETITFPDEEAATGYVEQVFTYPELCFAAQGDADVTGLAVYGTWLFLQSLADTHGDDAPIRLWENIAQYDGWEALEATLQDYGDTLTEMVARYHLQNLVRDYAMTPNFADRTVWLENNITGPGSWTFTGQGIQELAANYFAFAPGSGAFNVSVAGDDGSIELWAVGIKGPQATVFYLGRGADVVTRDFDEMYIVAFNTTIAEDVTSCNYAGYSIEVGAGTGAGATDYGTLDASQFASLGRR